MQPLMHHQLQTPMVAQLEQQPLKFQEVL